MIHNYWPFPRTTIALCSVAIFAGCWGGTGPKRYHLSGEVRYQGSPVDSGSITFEPQQPGIGGGFATIENGRYDTRKGGRGHLGGPHSVQIVGFKAPSAEAHPDDPPTSLFPPYVQTVNLEAKSTTMDFDIPSSNASK